MKAIAWGVALLLAGQASAAKPALLLIAEQSGREPTYWWHCQDREAQPLSDRVAAGLKRLGLTVIDRCDPKTPIHRTYHKASLRAFEQANLGGVMGAGRVLSGIATATTGSAPVPSLGLQHVHLSLELSVRDVDTDALVGKLTLAADGFDADPDIALSRARELLLAELWPRLPALARPARGGTARARILIKRLLQPADLDGYLKSLRATKGIAAARLAELTKTTAVVVIDPPQALETALDHLRSVGADISAAP